VVTISVRKNDHVEAVLAGAAQSGARTGFDRWRLRHRALPGIDLAEVDLSVPLLGRKLQAPLLISSMTGGSARTGLINRCLARVAETCGLALALGSMRAAIRHPELVQTFDVRAVAPSVPLFGNIGTVEVDVPAVAALVRRLHLDGLFVHLNALQEAVQPEGTPTFRHALRAIEDVVGAVGVPVFVKEVGFGLSTEDVRQVLGCGVAGVDVAGAGGTNWALGEGWRQAHAGRVAAAFADWGWPTADSLARAVRVRADTSSDVVVVASGGIGDGVTAVKALCLGADLVGLARPFLVGAAAGEDEALAAAAVIIDQLRIAAFACGVRTRAELNRALLVDTAARPDDEAS
jgi:isopentenyl-diphosphate delta-isomerase